MFKHELEEAHALTFYGCFELVFLVIIKLLPSREIFQSCACDENKLSRLRGFLACTSGEYARSVTSIRLCECTSLLVARMFQVLRLWCHTDVHFSEYLELTLVMIMRAFVLLGVSNCACGEHRSFSHLENVSDMRLWYKQVLRFESVSCMRLLEYTSFPFSKVFQASAGGGHTSLCFDTSMLRV